ncbi:MULTISPECIES: hypothetical protein [Pseudoalteromonas]|uniref:hypothetical protein n=1 Tax=Pseudoalteromonas TaxID=53246 RepID=UPI0015819032|nr:MULTISPECIES: hypothetical protein [Pseudoalteromonas]MDI4654241.1 hypothetical protein [Pseudoalteromonas shioyasakiensis]NUJ40195.1 hypothetical protein [Pseudoalteromonas sp. 0303]
MSVKCLYEQRFLKERRLFIIFAVISTIAPFLSLFEFLRPASETFATWFQRSGSIMVVVALLSEMHAYQMFDVFKPDGFVNTTYAETEKKYSPQVKLCNIVAFILIAIGTLIWGYGDIPFR